MKKHVPSNTNTEAFGFAGLDSLATESPELVPATEPVPGVAGSHTVGTDSESTTSPSVTNEDLSKGTRAVESSWFSNQYLGLMFAAVGISVLIGVLLFPTKKNFEPSAGPSSQSSSDSVKPSKDSEDVQLDSALIGLTATLRDEFPPIRGPLVFSAISDGTQS